MSRMTRAEPDPLDEAAGKRILRRMSRLRTLVETAIARLDGIGAGSRDVDDMRDRKSLLVLVSVLILPVSPRASRPGGQRRRGSAGAHSVSMP